KAASEAKCKNLIVLTWDYEAEERLDDKQINYLPLWKWLLGLKPLP
ncbi:MAG: AAA family ATPase, partial [Nitrospirae bacterium]|nr:AAA family ATPase [Nitrospirota bacterium]